MWNRREEVAEFILRHEGRVREIARRKLSPGARSAYGSEDVFATVMRRLDALAAKGLIHAESEAQLWLLIRGIVNNVSLHRHRLIESTACRSGEDAEFWSNMHTDLRRCEGDTEAFVLVYEMLMSLEDYTQRQIFMLRLRGVSHRIIAQQLGTTEQAARQRWRLIVAKLREKFEPKED